MDKDNIDAIDSFFADHPSSVKPIRTKSSQLHNNNHDRSTALSRKRRIDNDEATQPRSRSRKADPALDHSNIIKSDKQRTKKVELIPRNLAQEEYVEQLVDVNKRIVFAVGPAGTGKTMMAVLYAIKSFRNGSIDKIIITRPAVSVDEELGALPGDIIEKMAPFVRPIIDIFAEYYTKAEVLQLMEDGILEVCPLAFVRGRTFKNAVVILDESQSTTPGQLKATLTRIGSGSKMIITGDLRQVDDNRNGLSDFLEKIGEKDVPGVGIARFGHCDIERDPIIASILEIYGDKD